MSYSNYECYKNEYGGLIPEVDFLKALPKATRAVDKATQHRIGELKSWPAFTQEKVRLAECAQADFIAQYGDTVDFLNTVGHYSIGDVSVSAGEGAGSASALSKHYGLCEEAVQLLLPTGLLDRRLW